MLIISRGLNAGSGQRADELRRDILCAVKCGHPVQLIAHNQKKKNNKSI